MIVLTINCGSSSLKYQLIDMKDESVIAKGLVERIGSKEAVLQQTPRGGEKKRIETEIPDHKAAVQMVLDALTHPEYGVIESLDEIDAIGHRVAHGGERFTDSAVVNEDVLHDIEACCEIAPLHNPANLHGIKACMKLMPGKPEVAVFDTAFHQTMSQVAYLYGLPYQLYQKYGIRRYGFHGTSHKYVAQTAAEMLHTTTEKLRIISCHLGNGASIAAVKYGKSIDTSMGFTPLDGLVMGTRCGEIDPAIIPYLMEKESMKIEDIDKCMNKESGVLGISGKSSDFRDLEAAANEGDERCRLAIDMFAYRVRKYIGAYVSAMGGVDVIIFTAGLGENSGTIRREICEGLEYLGTSVDPERNLCHGVAQEISRDGSKVKILVIPTNVELMIAREAEGLCRKSCVEAAV